MVCLLHIIRHFSVQTPGEISSRDRSVGYYTMSRPAEEDPERDLIAETLLVDSHPKPQSRPKDIRTEWTRSSPTSYSKSSASKNHNTAATPTHMTGVASPRSRK